MIPHRMPFRRSAPKAPARAALALLCLLLAAACQTVPETVPEHFKLSVVPPEYLYRTLAARQAQLKDFKAFASTSISHPRLNQTLKQVVLLKSGEALRVDTLNLFGQPLAVFIHNGAGTLLYDTGQNRLYRREETREALEKILGLSIDFDEYADLVAGAVPRLKALRPAAATLDAGKKYYELILRQPGSKNEFRVQLDAYTLEPALLQKLNDGQYDYHVQWEDYQSVGGHSLAHRVTLSRPLRQEKLVVKFNQPTVNAGLPPQTFHFTPPGAGGAN